MISLRCFLRHMTPLTDEFTQGKAEEHKVQNLAGGVVLQLSVLAAALKTKFRTLVFADSNDA